MFRHFPTYPTFPDMSGTAGKSRGELWSGHIWCLLSFEFHHFKLFSPYHTPSLQNLLHPPYLGLLVYLPYPSKNSHAICWCVTTHQPHDHETPRYFQHQKLPFIAPPPEVNTGLFGIVRDCSGLFGTIPAIKIPQWQNRMKVQILSRIYIFWVCNQPSTYNS